MRSPALFPLPLSLSLTEREHRILSLEPSKPRLFKDPWTGAPSP